MLVQEPAVYFARTIQADDPMAYAAFLREHYLPAWNAMRNDHIITSLATVLTTEIREQRPNVPAWNIVQVGRVPDGALATTFFEAEIEALGRTAETSVPPGVTLRCETLRTTPNSHSPNPTAASLARRDDVIISVEYIHVTPSPQALEQYQRLMVESSGPAMRLLVESGAAYSFVPLETDTVLSKSAEMPDWNQLHFVAMFPVPRSEFRARFDEAITRVNPASGGFDGVFSRFDEIRTKPRWDIGRELAKLRIE